MSLKNYFSHYGQNNIFLSVHACLRAISIQKNNVLANRAAWLSTGLFLFPSPIKKMTFSVGGEKKNGDQR